jgi:hypothetical protein
MPTPIICRDGLIFNVGHDRIAVCRDNKTFEIYIVKDKVYKRVIPTESIMKIKAVVDKDWSKCFEYMDDMTDHIDLSGYKKICVISLIKEV